MSVWVSARKCNTVACAIGTYCLLHPRSKLKLKGNNSFSYPTFKYEDEVLEDFYAISMFLEISEEDAMYLFSSNYYDQKHERNPNIVARRIELYLEGYVDPGYWKGGYE